MMGLSGLPSILVIHSNRYPETMDVQIVLVGPDNVEEYGIGCVFSRSHPGYIAKRQWLDRSFTEGLRFFLAVDPFKRPLGIIEFVPGEKAWRPVDAEGWTFIHCLWVYPTGGKIGGIGSSLMEAVLAHSEAAETLGVATLASDGPWMAGPGFFERFGFVEAASESRYRLMAKCWKDAPLPKLARREGGINCPPALQLLYADQCPMLVKCAMNLKAEAERLGVGLDIARISSHEEAQRAPSFYGVMSLVSNGRVVADHYVSASRFRSIVQKELKLV